MTATQRRLTESGRIIATGRDIQRRADVRLLRRRIADLRDKHHDLTAKLIADELDELVMEINSATK